MKTDILFRRAFAENGEPVILVHRVDVQFDTLPENAKSGFDGVEPQQDLVDLDDLSSRWWLCSEGVKNLSELGYDRFRLARK